MKDSGSRPLQLSEIEFDNTIIAISDFVNFETEAGIPRPGLVKYYTLYRDPAQP